MTKTAAKKMIDEEHSTRSGAVVVLKEFRHFEQGQSFSVYAKFGAITEASTYKNFPAEDRARKYANEVWVSHNVAPLADVKMTLPTFANAKRHNYSKLPDINVEILADVVVCSKCDAELVHDAKKKGSVFGGFVHAVASDTCSDEGYVSAKTRCSFCHSSEDAVYRQHAWHDAVECSRCGGENGHAIGD